MLRVWIWPAVRSSPRLGRVIGFICIHESLGYLKPLGNRQHIRASRRSATGVIMATVAVLLIAGGCGPEPTPRGGGRRGWRCRQLSHRARRGYRRAGRGHRRDGPGPGRCCVPQGLGGELRRMLRAVVGRFKERTKPVPGNHEYYTQGARGYFEYFGEAAGGRSFSS
jgi:hypothetical protein